MDAQSIIEAESKYILHTYNRPPLVFERGEGAYLFDTDGHKYLDFVAGIAVTVLGHSDAEWVTAVSQQAARLTHVSNLYHTAPHAQLAQRLVENSFADKVFFCNSGAEANEAALKFARKFARQQGSGAPRAQGAGEQGSKRKIVAFSGAFHGRTMGALAATYKEAYRAPFAPLLPGVTFAPFNDVEMLAEVIDDDTCAVIVEPIQGEGGIHPARIEFLHLLRQRCDAAGALLIFDEIQCGLGRTGHLWAHEGYGVTPDIMTLAKPLAGGLPIGAALVTQRVADVIQPGDHGSTFAAGPLVCAAANVVFDRVNRPEFLAQVKANGAYLKERLWQLPAQHLAQVRGAGLMVGLALNGPALPLVHAARERGLLIVNAGENVIRLVPPLIVTREEIDTAVTILGECLA